MRPSDDTPLGPLAWPLGCACGADNVCPIASEKLPPAMVTACSRAGRRYLEVFGIVDDHERCECPQTRPFKMIGTCATCRHLRILRERVAIPSWDHDRFDVR